MVPLSRKGRVRDVTVDGTEKICRGGPGGIAAILYTVMDRSLHRHILCSQFLNGGSKMYQSFSRFIKLECQRCLIPIFKAVGAVLNVLFQDQILGVFPAPPFLATATFPRMCYDRLIKTKTTLRDAFLIF